MARVRSASASSCSRRARLSKGPIPARWRPLARRARALDHLLRRIVSLSGALDDPPPARAILWNTFKALLLVLLGFPVAVLGVVAWWVPYRLCGIDREPRAGRRGAARPDRALQARSRASCSSRSRSRSGPPPPGRSAAPLWAALAFLFFHSQESLLFSSSSTRPGASARRASSSRSPSRRAGSRACAPSATRSSPSATGWPTCLAAQSDNPSAMTSTPEEPTARLRAGVVRPRGGSRSSRVLLFHLVPALLAGFLAHGRSCTSMARRLRGGRVSHGLARALAAGLLGLVAAAARRARDRAPPSGVSCGAGSATCRPSREDGGDARGARRRRWKGSAFPLPAPARRIDRGGRRTGSRARGRAPARGHRRRSAASSTRSSGPSSASSSSSGRPRTSQAPLARRSGERSRRFDDASGPSRRPRSRSPP